MAIIRKAHDKENPYVLIARETIQNTSLSWEARGLLTFLLSLPDNWKVHKSKLHMHSKNGRRSTDRIFKELEEAKYIKAVSQYKKKKEKFKCQLCNSSEELCTHHKTYENLGKEIDHLDDLIVLCSKCHEKFHDIGVQND